jgi:hypothetical protein
MPADSKVAVRRTKRNGIVAFAYKVGFGQPLDNPRMIGNIRNVLVTHMRPQPEEQLKAATNA